MFVNVGPSEARRRLKGFGHGVRKVQTAGRKQAVIIHTATGQHLEELRAKFADVGHASDEHGLSEPIENLRNLGPTSGTWLREVGIATVAELKSCGPAIAFQMVKQRRPDDASLNLLWALAAGLLDKDWRDLSEAEKQKLRQEIAS